MGRADRAAVLAALPLAAAAYVQRRQLAAGLRQSPVGVMRRAGYEPDDWQADLLSSDAQQILLNVTRQGGKSRVASVLATHTAIYEPGSPILVLSPSLRQSGELFRNVLNIYERSGRLVPAEAETKLMLELENGSRILSLPGKEGTIRGFSGVKLVLIDEASRVSDDLYYAVRPMLATSGGRIVLLSTPFGKRGFFFHEWQDGGPEWKRVKVQAAQISRIPAEFLERERRILPAWVYAQEYDCEFSETMDAAFRFDDIMASMDPDLLPLWTPVRNGHSNGILEHMEAFG